MIPVRIQRKRTPGYDMQAESYNINKLPAISCTRPGLHGNPYPVGKTINGITATTIEASLALFRVYAEKMAEVNPNWLYRLKGANLACFCKLSDPCHVDILLEMANT